MEVEQSAQSRIPRTKVGILCFLIILIFTPAVYAAVHLDTDYLPHILWAIGLSETGHFEKPIPQFLYHISLIVISSPIPISDTLARFNIGAVILGVICYLSTGLIVFYWLLISFYQSIRQWRIPIILTLVLLLVGPINVFTWSSQNLYLGYLVANVYHNPTIVLLKPFALLLFLFALRIIDARKISWQMLVLCAGVAVLGVFAKPNYAIALLPALIIVVIYAYAKKWIINWALLGTLILPTLGALGWQFFFYQTGNTGRFEFAPLAVMSAFSPDGLLLKLVLSITFPAVVYLLYYRQAHAEFALNLAWLVFWVAAASAYLLAERGNEFHAGNFTWGSQIALFILFVVSVSFLMRQNIGGIQSRLNRMKLAICLTLLVLHLAGGLALYLAHLTINWPTWW